MSDTDPYDETADFYPTEEELAVLDTFQGSPREYVDYLQEIYKHGYGNLHVQSGNIADSSSWSEKIHRITFVTGGWSGNEEIIGRITGPHEPSDVSMFQMLFWESTHRGGKFVYDVPDKQWEEPRFLGLITKMPKPAGE